MITLLRHTGRVCGRLQAGRAPTETSVVRLRRFLGGNLDDSMHTPGAAQVLTEDVASGVMIPTPERSTPLYQSGWVVADSLERGPLVPPMTK